MFSNREAVFFAGSYSQDPSVEWEAEMNGFFFLFICNDFSYFTSDVMFHKCPAPMCQFILVIDLLSGIIR